MKLNFKSIILNITICSISIFAENYTLEQSISIALKNSPDIKKSDKEFRAVDAQISEAWGSAAPSISLQGKYELSEQYDLDMDYDLATMDLLDPTNQYYNASNAPLAGSFLQDIGTLADLLATKSNSANLSLVLQQVIFAQGKISTGLDIAKTYKKSLKAQRVGIESTIRLEVTNAFNQAVFFKDAVNIYLESIELAEKHYNQVKTMYNNGLVSELDYLKAQLQIEDLKSSKDKMLKDFELAKNALLNKMGLEYDKSVVLEGQLQIIEQTANYDDALRIAIENRSELKQLKQGIKMQELLIDIEKADYLPLIYGGGALTRMAATNDFIPDRNEWFTDARVFIGLEWNLFNGFQTKQKVVQAKVNVEKTEIQKAHVEKSLALQIEAEKGNLNEAIARENIKKRMVELAQKAVTIANVSYENSTATQLDVLDANMALRSAKLDHLQAVLDINTANNNLLNAMGQF